MPPAAAGTLEPVCCTRGSSSHLVRVQDFQEGFVDVRLTLEAVLDLVDVVYGVIELHGLVVLQRRPAAGRRAAHGSVGLGRGRARRGVGRDGRVGLAGWAGVGGVVVVVVVVTVLLLLLLPAAVAMAAAMAACGPACGRLWCWLWLGGGPDAAALIGMFWTEMPWGVM
ncbi:hypothetical protein EYF80_061216 [Liparis tanakae]|uniref:Uncharacterized protein n=1 Tax=Liparis tanakae TaxID=230148 RepID=A0A4Z2EIF4_9TELE|nr:hypothetical protein EYF80_061216 [Liparis tanakae]